MYPHVQGSIAEMHWDLSRGRDKLAAVNSFFLSVARAGAETAHVLWGPRDKQPARNPKICLGAVSGRDFP